MIEGKKILQISLFPANADGTQSAKFFEREHKVTHFKQYLEKDERVGRKRDLIQFWTDPGGLRTVAAEDLVID